MSLYGVSKRVPQVWVMSTENNSYISKASLQWRHNGRDSVSNHQPHDCWLNRLFRRRSSKISKLRVTGLCAGNSPGTGEFPAQMASYAENVSIWWRHHVMHICKPLCVCICTPLHCSGKPCQISMWEISSSISIALSSLYTTYVINLCNHQRWFCSFHQLCSRLFVLHNFT